MAPDPTHRHPDEEPRVESLIGTLPCVLYGYVRWPDGRNRFV
jgi:hypothetical protein